MDSKPIYKTAEELGIEQWEHDGLVALIGPLSRGDLPGLDMSFAVHPDHDCGTVHCIGGWLAFNKGFDRNGIGAYVGRHIHLNALFYPWESREQFFFYRGIEQHHAARAIVNFLVTGDPQWDAVMAEA